MAKLHRVPRVARILNRAVLAGIAMALTGCAVPYVDNGLAEVSPSEYTRPETPKPVQFLFTFKTKGATNTRATDLLKQQAETIVAESGLFASSGKDPVPSGALLSITIDNIAITSMDDAAAKGFVTGLTLGLAGNTVTDGYVGTLEYAAGTGQAKVTKTVRHAIHGTVGAEGAPPNATKAASVKEAVETMTRRVISNLLKDLSRDLGFQPGAGS